MIRRFSFLACFLVAFRFFAFGQESPMGSIINPLPPSISSPSIVNKPYWGKLQLNSPSIDFKHPSLINPDSLSYSPIDKLTVSSIAEPNSSPFAWRYNIYGNDFNRAGAIKSWDGGFVYGSSSYSTFPSIGSVGAAAIGFSQEFGKWTVSAGISAQKYNFVRSNYNSFGLNGQVSYRVNDNVSFNAFGNYQTNAIFNSMAAMPYVSQSVVGGYMSLLTNNQKWGVDLGAQSYYDPYSRQWVTVPIVQPYFNLNGQKLGVDFGGLIKQLFMSLSESQNGGYNYSPQGASFRPQNVGVSPSHNGGPSPMIYIPRH